MASACTNNNCKQMRRLWQSWTYIGNRMEQSLQCYGKGMSMARQWQGDCTTKAIQYQYQEPGKGMIMATPLQTQHWKTSIQLMSNTWQWHGQEGMANARKRWTTNIAGPCKKTMTCHSNAIKQQAKAWQNTPDNIARALRSTFAKITAKAWREHGKQTMAKSLTCHGKQGMSTTISKTLHK